MAKPHTAIEYATTAFRSVIDVRTRDPYSEMVWENVKINENGKVTISVKRNEMGKEYQEIDMSLTAFRRLLVAMREASRRRTRAQRVSDQQRDLYFREEAE